MCSCLARANNTNDIAQLHVWQKEAIIQIISNNVYAILMSCSSLTDKVHWKPLTSFFSKGWQPDLFVRQSSLVFWRRQAFCVYVAYVWNHDDADWLSMLIVTIGTTIELCFMLIVYLSLKFMVASFLNCMLCITEVSQKKQIHRCRVISCRMINSAMFVWMV